MKSARIPGATRVLGKSQGYLGLAVRDELANCTVNGEGTPSMTTSWEPLPHELAAIAAGAHIHVTLLGSSHPPILVSVGEPPATPT